MKRFTLFVIYTVDNIQKTIYHMPKGSCEPLTQNKMNIDFPDKCKNDGGLDVKKWAWEGNIIQYNLKMLLKLEPESKEFYRHK